ncbi:RsiW-degrading membrane proteinase PrsW (M82 family) [Actinoplanes octamycinicus]|uniref:RsiW-degrading membrane proteinase PrsW (M82 family) n=1 Tax=Actinoplanes octamycinicus TaxID=135948 RepID=A0A7W7H613_9ACTN|nr:hypothetical protein [Actinoplanes octamycinicus]MBB4744670.1 RsiW-degrading membrane proteinase PrsW (M82 family) [Actinoplanes octamycinicus]GIE55251.1 hypothetical protein Aoc01nite_06530 [Actinoplanes octamycinicus]
MPNVEVSVSPGVVILVLGVLLLLIQPGAIPFTYALVIRHQRRGGGHPLRFAIGAYLLGALLTLMFVAVFACSDFPYAVAVLLGYLPMWLFSLLILRTAEARPDGPRPE